MHLSGTISISDACALHIFNRQPLSSQSVIDSKHHDMYCAVYLQNLMIFKTPMDAQLLSQSSSIRLGTTICTRLHTMYRYCFLISCLL